MSVIEDGSGDSYTAKVDSDQRLNTKSVIQSRVSDVSKREGNSFLLASGFVSLTTTGSFNGMLYLKNTSDDDLYIATIRTCSDTAGNLQVKIIKNPTLGTLISDANVALKASSNYGSSKEFGGLVYSASGDGKTVTDGDDSTTFINHSPGHSIQEYQGAIIIPKGKSMAIVTKPSVATTACVEIQCWFEGDE